MTFRNTNTENSQIQIVLPSHADDAMTKYEHLNIIAVFAERTKDKSFLPRRNHLPIQAFVF